MSFSETLPEHVKRYLYVEKQKRAALDEYNACRQKLDEAQVELEGPVKEWLATQKGSRIHLKGLTPEEEEAFGTDGLLKIQYSTGHAHYFNQDTLAHVLEEFFRIFMTPEMPQKSPGEIKMFSDLATDFCWMNRPRREPTRLPVVRHFSRSNKKRKLE